MDERSARQQQRREDVAAAVWRVLDAAGFAGLSVRAVAAEMGASTGVVTHHFASKRELTSFALDLLATSSAARVRRRAEPGLPALRAALLDVLPLDEESRTANRVWVSSWDAALGDAGHATEHAGRYRVSRRKVRDLLEGALREHGGDVVRVDERAEVLHAGVLGLAVQAVLDPAAYPAARQVALVDALLADVVQVDDTRDDAADLDAADLDVADLDAAVDAWHAAVTSGDLERAALAVGDPVVVLGPRGAGPLSPEQFTDWVHRSGVRMVPGDRHRVSDRLVVVEQEASWPGDPTGTTVATVFRVRGGRVTACLRRPDVASALELAVICREMAATE